jgi:hypothetical protein
MARANGEVADIAGHIIQPMRYRRPYFVLLRNFSLLKLSDFI